MTMVPHHERLLRNSTRSNNGWREVSFFDNGRNMFMVVSQKYVRNSLDIRQKSTRLHVLVTTWGRLRHVLYLLHEMLSLAGGPNA